MAGTLQWLSVRENMSELAAPAADELQEELSQGISAGDDAITSFKIEQKITDVSGNGQLAAGPFIKGQSSISRMRTRYMVVMFSNKFSIITDIHGSEIKKRYGYGFGFLLNVYNISAKINANYSIIAASANLELAKAEYELEIAGVIDGSMAAHMPDNSGDFKKETFKSLKEFIEAAKKQMANQPIGRLYPIEILGKKNISTERSDYFSMYFAAKKLSDGIKLNEALRSAQDIGAQRTVNSNVLQFIYAYFDVKDAYTEPTPLQRQNAANWIKGDYNKQVSDADDSGRVWVAIDPAVEDGKFVVLSSLPGAGEYQPHPAPADWATTVKKMEDSFSYISQDQSSDLKLASIMETSGKLNSVSIVRDISLYTDVSGNIPGSKVVETRYGVGIRLILRISNVEFGTKISYGSIGASAEMGFANVEYEISGIGIADPSILADFPGPQDITQDTMEQINTAFNNLKNKLATMGVSDMKPQPYRIRVYDAGEVDTTMYAQAAVFGITQISEKEELKDAITKARQKGLKEESIRSIYKDFAGITADGDHPDGAKKREAKRWLDLNFS